MNMPGSCRAGLVDRGLRREAVRCEQLDGAVVRPEHGDLVLDHLGAVLVDEPSEEDRVGVRALDLLHDRLVARGLRIPGLEAGDLDPDMLRGLARRRRDAEAVGLLVVEDVDALHALLLHELGLERALVVVRGGDARVVARTARVVLRRLAGCASARQVHGQTRVRVRRRHHRDAAVRRLVQERDDDRRAARVEGADDADRPHRSPRRHCRSASTWPSPTLRPERSHRRRTGTRRCSRRPSSHAARARTGSQRRSARSDSATSPGAGSRRRAGNRDRPRPRTRAPCTRTTATPSPRRRPPSSSPPQPAATSASAAMISASAVSTLFFAVNLSSSCRFTR